MAPVTWFHSHSCAARSHFSLEPIATPCPNDKGVDHRFHMPGDPGDGPGTRTASIGGGNGSKLRAPGSGNERLQIVPRTLQVTHLLLHGKEPDLLKVRTSLLIALMHN